MRKRAVNLAKVALGSILVIGLVTESMAHGGGHGGGFGGGHGFGGLAEGHHSTPAQPLYLNHGFGHQSFRGFRGRHLGSGLGGRRVYGNGWGPGNYWGPDYYGYNGYDGDAAYCASVHPTYDPRTGTYLGYGGRLCYCP